VTSAVPEVDAINVDEQVADAVVPARVHAVKDPVAPVTPREMVPVGVIAVPGEVSVTVTSQADP